MDREMPNPPARGLLLALLMACGCGGGDVPLPDLPIAFVRDTSGLVARGEYLVRNVAVCGHCHSESPDDPDGPLSGGHEFSGWRLGTIAAANLTPDPATGLGEWSEAEIVRAIRSGEDADGEVLAPVMPYEWFHGMADSDALAIARYLKSLPPVPNDVVDNENLIFDFAELILLEPDASPSPRTAPARSATAAYGEYLATSVALCADCHTPRTGLMQRPDRDRLLAGNSAPPEGFPANPANLTPDGETGLGRWTEADFFRALRQGVRPDGEALHEFMPWKQLGRMTDGDLRAIWLYLRALPPIRNSVPEREQAQ